ncbi:MAG: GTP cyclohydrolase IIa [Marine Group I thaumarchaeote]|jgi:GTP cyclohydrolase IIa|uniref:GTP cyclohydrolase III n=2 Tax=Nitrososphaerota TaxID=651137 RepID=A0A7K4MCQ0_9ARCH|nr:putative GGDN family protein [uncultured marine crenarchaeote HF4000_APKG8D6]NMJ67427.1 GTP cyclohydrolase IIa [Marine Group I thaumarchaeote]PBO83045.1 MAG: GTP cyclohydrolase [Nitrosopumilales archaeon]NWJ21816.1 GTP cyclohydrolase IIa [Marine Group I thaumarchaeote]NWJ77795.1 GTP cyclohydrolase IIa [Marine Group I thaumarchaeote]
MIQITIIKIAGYGPWTLTLGSDREHEIQMLQASLYLQIQKLFSYKNGLAFSNRSDEFFVITNGITLEDHIEIQKKLESSFDLKLSMSIGYGDSPFEANLSAYDGKKSEIKLNEEHNIFGFIDGKLESKVTIMHFDVDNLTSRRKTISPYEISSLMFKLYASMSEYFLAKKSLSFFMGGDNFMVVANLNYKQSAEEFIEIIKNEFGIDLNCGIGTGKTARSAAKFATRSLDTIREIRDSGKEKPEIYEIV